MSIDDPREIRIPLLVTVTGGAEPADAGRVRALGKYLNLSPAAIAEIGVPTAERTMREMLRKAIDRK